MGQNELSSKYIYFEGNQVMHGCLGSWVNYQEKVAGYSRITDFCAEQLDKGRTDIHVGGKHYPIVSVSDGEMQDFSLQMMHVQLTDWRVMDVAEVKQYLGFLESHNLVFKCLNTYDLVLCWKDIDLMPISVNGVQMTLAEFKAVGVDGEQRITNAYDNGYSHWGECTTDGKTLMGLIDKMCSEYDRGNRFSGGVVQCGEVWTWTFDRHGVLQVKFTDGGEDWSCTTNS